MRKLFKKSLACVLAVALCLTAMVGVVVSADTVEPLVGTIAIADVNIKAGETSATIPVTFTVTGDEDDLINTGYINLEVDGVTVDLIHDGKDGIYTSEDDLLWTNPDKTLFEIWLDETGVGGSKETTVYIVVTIAEGTESFTVKCYDKSSATNTEKLIEFVEDTKTFTITPAHEHNYSYEYNEDAHWQVCANEDNLCDAVKTAEEAHKYVDGFCVCGAAEPVVGHEHAYTYEYDEDGHWQVCANTDGLCDVVTTTEDAHVFDETTGLCACGLKLDSALTLYRASLAFSESSLDYNFRFLKTGVLDLYDDVTFVLTPDKYDTTTLNLVENPTSIVVHESELVSASSKHMQYTYSDFFLYELALDIDYEFRAYDDGKLVAISNSFTISPAEDLKTNIAGSTEAGKKAYTDLLVVCDEYMKVTGDSKPGSDLDNTPSILDGFDTSAKTETVEDWEKTDSLTPYNSDYGMGNSSLAHEIRVSVQTEKVPFFNIRIMDKKNALDVNKLAITVTYTSKDSAGEHPYTETFTGADFKDASAYVELKFDKVGLHDSDKVIKFEATYDGAPIFDYYRSVESYTGAGQSAGQATDNAMKALLHFGQSFRAFMGL